MTKKSKPRGAFVLYLYSESPDDPQKSVLITATAPTPLDSTIFQVFSWGVWIRDDEDVQYWLPWSHVFRIEFREEEIWYLPGDKEKAKKEIAEIDRIQEDAMKEFEARKEK